MSEGRGKVEVLGILLQATHHPASHRQIQGEIDGPERVIALQSFLPQAAHNPVGHPRALRRIHRWCRLSYSGLKASSSTSEADC